MVNVRMISWHKKFTGLYDQIDSWLLLYNKYKIFVYLIFSHQVFKKIHKKFTVKIDQVDKKNSSSFNTSKYYQNVNLSKDR